MPSTNNDDFLSQVQLTAVRYLEEHSYFQAAGIPVVSEVKEDVFQAVKQKNPKGMICIVALSDFDLDSNGGTLATRNLDLIVRVRETRSLNMGSSGTRENCLRVAQMVAIALGPMSNPGPAAMSSDATPARMGGTLQPRRIERAAADEPGVIAWHVHFSVNGGGLCGFTYRGASESAAP